MKYLRKKLKNKSGRNNTGKITVRHKQGTFKRSLLRTLNYEMLLYNKFEYYAPISLIHNKIYNIRFIKCVTDKEDLFILPLTKGVNLDEKVYCFSKHRLNLGSIVQIKDVPLGSKIFWIGNSKAQYSKAPGSYSILKKKIHDDAIIKLKSGVLKRISVNDFAIFGESSNSDYKLISWRKAGKSRIKGIRPTVRGVAMNPVDHPHGGGEGKTSGGRTSVSPWGKQTKGKITVKKKNKVKLDW